MAVENCVYMYKYKYIFLSNNIHKDKSIPISKMCVYACTHIFITSGCHDKKKFLKQKREKKR